MARKSGRFQFDGGAGTYLGTGILAALITIFTSRQQWKVENTDFDTSWQPEALGGAAMHAAIPFQPAPRITSA